MIEKLIQLAITWQVVGKSTRLNQILKNWKMTRESSYWSRRLCNQNTMHKVNLLNMVSIIDTLGTHNKVIVILQK